jgi:hypothetical protein
MTIQTLWLLTCSPLVVTLAAWAGVRWKWSLQRPAPVALGALGVATLNAAAAAGVAARYRFQPSLLPPWHDPQTLDLGLLLLPAGLAMIVGLVALGYKAPMWLVAVVELSSIPLLIVGLYVGSFV